MTQYPFLIIGIIGVLKSDFFSLLDGSGDDLYIGQMISSGVQHDPVCVENLLADCLLLKPAGAKGDLADQFFTLFEAEKLIGGHHIAQDLQFPRLKLPFGQVVLILLAALGHNIKVAFLQRGNILPQSLAGDRLFLLLKIFQQL